MAIYGPTNIEVDVPQGNDTPQVNDDPAVQQQPEETPQGLNDAAEHTNADSHDAVDSPKHFSSVHQGEHVSHPKEEDIAGGKTEEEVEEEEDSDAGKKGEGTKVDISESGVTFESFEEGLGGIGGATAGAGVGVTAAAKEAEQTAEGSEESTDAATGTSENVTEGAKSSSHQTILVAQAEGTIEGTEAAAAEEITGDTEIEAETEPEITTPTESATTEENTNDDDDDKPIVTDEEPVTERVFAAPTLTVENASGAEDSNVSLNITITSNNPHITNETITVSISNVPAGATLSAGSSQGGGVWEVDSSDLADLTITPTENSSEDFKLLIEATATDDDNSDASETTDSTEELLIELTPVADAPSLTVTGAVTGNEDTAIPLTISSSLVDASETLSDITISRVPDGATLSAGKDNGDGSWVLTSAELAGLTITPPSNSDADFELSIDVTSTESDATIATSSDTITVTVQAVLDGAVLTADDVSGDEDTSILLGITASLIDTDGSETLGNVTISGVLNGSLSVGTDQGDSIWTVTQAQLAGLSFVPDNHFSGSVDLTVTVTASESGGTPLGVVSPMTVTVNPVADTPNLTVTDAVTGNEDTTISLTISASLIDASETLSNVTISGVPTGATFFDVSNAPASISAVGTNNGDGSWTFTVAELSGLAIKAPGDSDVDFQLTVEVTSTESDDTTATASKTIDVTVDGVADAPTLTANDVFGTQGTAIALDVTSALTDKDGSETLSIDISGVPADATFSTGTDNGDGSWTFTKAQLTGLEFNAPSGGEEHILTVTATSTESGSGDTANTATNFSVVAFDVQQGTKIDNTLTGTAAPDQIFGAFGDDTISGLGGRDELHGDGGDDRITGGGGDDVLFGGTGNDTFFFTGLSGTDTVDGGSVNSSSWTDIIQLGNATQAPSATIDGLGSWVLTTSDAYTIDAVFKTITFDDGDASGTITLFGSGNEITFSNIDQIQWDPIIPEEQI